MKRVTSNDFYEIDVDQAKNRIYFTMRGSWTNPKDMPNWLQDVEAAVKLCSPGFTELIDWTGASSVLLTDYIAGAQKIAQDGGLRKAARIFDRDTFIKLQMDTLTQKTGFPVKTFFERSEAESWLDAAD